MPKRVQKRESQQRAAAAGDPRPKFIGSLRSQASVTKEWGLKADLKTCKAQIGLWERKLATAGQGVTRNSAQIAAGNGMAHSTLEGYVQDVSKAKQMIAAFQEQAASLQRQIDDLQPTPEKAVERAEGQRVLCAQVEQRLQIDRKLDGALEAVRQILRERAALTSEMVGCVASLDFNHNFDLDDQRFDALLRVLPEGMAGESEKWVTWFLGREDGRSPYMIQRGKFTLRETLASHNAFCSGDSVNLTKKEEAEVERIDASRGPFAPPVEAPPNRIGQAAEEVRPENIRWAMLR